MRRQTVTVSVNDRRRLKRIVFEIRVIFPANRIRSLSHFSARSRLSCPIIFIPRLGKQFVACRLVSVSCKNPRPYLPVDNVDAGERSFTDAMRIYESFARKNGRIRRRQGAPDSKNSGHFLLGSRCNVPVNGRKYLDIAAATGKIAISVASLRVANRDKFSAMLNCVPRTFYIKIPEHYFFRYFLFLLLFFDFAIFRYPSIPEAFSVSPAKQENVKLIPRKSMRTGSA